MKKSTLAKLLFLLAAIFYGMAYAFIREGVVLSNPYTFLFYRFLIACGLFFIIFYPKIIRIDKETIKYGIILGIPFALSIIFLTIGLETTSASKAGFLGGLYIIFVPFALGIIKKELPLWHHVVAIVVATFGVGVISLNSDFSIARGDIYVLLWAAIFAVYIVLVGKYAKNHDVAQITFVQFAFTLLITGILASITKNFALPAGYAVWQAIIFMAVFATIITYLIQNRYQRYISEVTAGLIFTTEPIFAAISAYLILGEIITPRIIIGGAIILLALIISELPLNKLISRTT